MLYINYGGMCVPAAETLLTLSHESPADHFGHHSAVWMNGQNSRVFDRFQTQAKNSPLQVASSYPTFVISS